MSCANVPKLTLIVGGSYGAGNYGTLFISIASQLVDMQIFVTCLRNVWSRYLNNIRPVPELDSKLFQRSRQGYSTCGRIRGYL